MFTVSLELIKQGLIEVNQNKNFGTIRIKSLNEEERKNQEEIRA